MFEEAGGSIMKKKMNSLQSRKENTRRPPLPLATLCLLALLLVALAMASDYYLEYYAFGLDGAVSYTADYQMTDLLQIEGVTADLQSSDDYSITSAIGHTDQPLRASNWMLYE